MLGYSVAQYLSRFQISTPLWGEKLIPLLDYTFSNNYINSGELSEAFYQIVHKYTNTTELPLESLNYYVKEMGYEYILEFFQPDEEGAQRLVSFLVLIHLLKGSRKGLELILNIMGIKGEILEWYETDPLGSVNTFTLTIDSSTLINNQSPETYRNFEKFVRNYVYPEVKFIIKYDANITYKIYSDMQGTMKIKYPCYINANLGIISERSISLTLVTDINWTYNYCYKDVYNRIIPNSNKQWQNLNSVTWQNTGIYYGQYGIWDEPCVGPDVSGGVFAESLIIDTGESLNTTMLLTYNKIILHPSSSIVVKWRTSNDNITWTEYTEFNGSITNLRYYQFKVIFYCPQNRLAILT